jgi:hypothetical protein
MGRNFFRELRKETDFLGRVVPVFEKVQELYIGPSREKSAQDDKQSGDGGAAPLDSRGRLSPHNPYETAEKREIPRPAYENAGTRDDGSN